MPEDTAPLGAAASADILTGKVVKITDGDTLYVLDANYQQHKIRLAGIEGDGGSPVRAACRHYRRGRVVRPSYHSFSGRLGETVAT